MKTFRGRNANRVHFHHAVSQQLAYHGCRLKNRRETTLPNKLWRLKSVFFFHISQKHLVCSDTYVRTFGGEVSENVCVPLFICSKTIHSENETPPASERARPPDPDRSIRSDLSRRTTAIKADCLRQQTLVLTTCSSDGSALGDFVQPANAHINLSCSLRKQFIPRNDFIISQRFTESHNTSPLSDNHSVIVLPRQFALPVSQDAHTQTHRKWVCV